MTMRTLLKIGGAMAIWWAVQQVLAGATPVSVSLIMLLASVVGALAITWFGWDRATQVAPRPGRVRFAEVTYAAGVLLAVGLAPSGPKVAHAVGGVLVVATAVIAAAVLARLHQAWQPRATVLGLLVDSWGRIPGRVRAPLILTAASLGGASTMFTPGGAFVGIALAAVAGRRYWGRVRGDATTRATVTATLAGVLAGGEWTALHLAARVAPIKSISLDDDGVPSKIVIPIPEAMPASAQAAAEQEIAERLSGWGCYSVRWHTGGPGGDRRAVITWWPPLPTLVHYDGRPAVGRKMWLGIGRVNREMLATRPDAVVGAQEDVYLDLADTPHALIVGGTGGGKSVVVTTLLIQWLKAGHLAVILDPKRVGFNRFKGKRGALRVATDIYDIRDTIVAIRGEMDARYARMEATGLDNIMDLPEGERPRPLLAVIDEASEAMNVEKVSRDDAEGQARNEAAMKIRAEVSSIARLGRAAGVHVITLTQRADVQDGLAGSTRNNLEARILLGAADSTARAMAGFASSDVAATPGVRGRGIYGRVNTGPCETQFAYAPNEEIERFLADLAVEESAPVAYGTDGVAVVEAHAAATGTAARLDVLAAAIDAGDLADDDARRCGYDGGVAEVREVLDRYAARLAASEADAAAEADASKVDEVRQRGRDRVRSTPTVQHVEQTAQTSRTDMVAAPAGEDDPDGLDAMIPSRTLDSVGGYEDVKARLLDVVGTAFRDAESAADYGVETGGVLLYGPPGTGKTFIAEALAGSLGVRYLALSVGDLTGKYIGDGATKIRAAVEAASMAAPCILMIDEIDAVAGRRDDENSSEGRKGVNEILVQIDRIRRIPGVVLVATTNHLDRLDPAVIRDGRMAARIRIDLPDQGARQGILEASLTGRPVGQVDVVDVAGRTHGYSAAMLTSIVDVAARAAMRDGKRPIATDDLVFAIRERGGQDRPTVDDAGLDGLVLPPATEAALRQILMLLSDPDRAHQFGIKPPSGLLLYGPPGTGKTSIARALAAESKTSFYAVKPSEWTSKWQGESEQAIRELFARARENAPAVIFLDEIDSIGGRRGEHDSVSSARILTPLLAEMDGFDSAAAGGAPVFVIGATNRPDVLDEALTRPGRLSASVEIGLPDEAGRTELLRRMTAAMTLDADIDLEALAQRTDGMSPADVAGLCQQAGLAAMRRSPAVISVDAAAFEEALTGDAPEPASAEVERESEAPSASAGEPAGQVASLDDWLAGFPDSPPAA
jgi:transitional endoplasmic reticulum ATPase